MTRGSGKQPKRRFATPPEPVGSETVGLIPVFKRGDEVAAWSVVDEDTFLWVKHHRYHLCEGYAAYSFRLKSGPLTARGSRKLIRCFVHRDLMRLGYGDKRVVDHINGDRLDNRLANLRILTLEENAQNKPSHQGSTSHHRGVSWYAPREEWRVAVMVNGKRTLVGYFSDEDDAGAAAHAFYEAHVPYRRKLSTTARPGTADAVTVGRPGVDNSGQVEAHLVTVNTP